MKVKVEIDSSDILMFTTYEEDREIAREMLAKADYEDLVNEIIKRGLVADVLYELGERELEEIMAEYGYFKKE